MILMLAALACSLGGAADDPTPLPDANPTAALEEPTVDDDSQNDTNPDPVSDTENIYQVGEKIHFGQGIIRLNSLTFSGDRMRANFTFQNNSSQPLDIDPQDAFSAVDGEGTELDLTVLECGRSQLFGRVLGRDRLRGNLCWKDLTIQQGIEIAFQADFLDGRTYRWEGAEGSSEPDLGQIEVNPSPAVIGQPAPANHYLVTLLETSTRDGLLQADFRVENTTDQELQFSSLLALEVRRGDGSRLGRELLECAQETLNGPIPAGESIEGSACWSLDAGDPARIYFLNVFSGDVVYWNVEQ